MGRLTLVYYDGGIDFRGEFELTKGDFNSLKNKAKENGQVSYVSGFVRFNLATEYNKTKRVIIFLTDDSQAEIGKRSKNGLLRANWRPI